MAKKMSNLKDVVKNAKIDYDKKMDNVGHFNKGSDPQEFGPDDDVPGGSPEVENEIGAYELENDSPEAHGKDIDKKVKTPREPVLNAVSWPNNNKGKRVDRSVLNVKHDAPKDQKWSGADVPVGGTPMPQNIH